MITKDKSMCTDVTPPRSVKLIYIIDFIQCILIFELIKNIFYYYVPDMVASYDLEIRPIIILFC